MITFVGIDQSLTSTGLVLVDETMHVISSDTILTGKLRGVERLDVIVQKIMDRVDIRAGENELVVVREGYSYGSKSSCLFDLGELGGCINLEMYRSGRAKGNVSMFELPPTTWKKFVFGKGDTQKDTNYLMKAFKMTGMEFKDDNQADAYMMIYTFIELKYPRKVVFGEMTVDQKMASISAHARKINKITDRNIGKLGPEDFRKLVDASIEEYRIF